MMNDNNTKHMKQSFSIPNHQKFKDYFWIQEKPWKWDSIYIKKAKKYIWYIKWIPWLRMIWVWNSTSMNYGTKESDIDLFIVTEKNRMRLVRILITLIFQILWIRKTNKKHAWRFCLSFFVTTDWLDFWNFALENDIYLYFWIIYFKPILDYNNTYDTFLEKNSKWADLSQYQDIIKENKKCIYYKKDRKKQQPYLLNSIDTVCKKLFFPKTLKHYEKLWKPYGVIIGDDILKFHNNDQRKHITKHIFRK